VLLEIAGEAVALTRNQFRALASLATPASYSSDFVRFVEPSDDNG
jgi:hypothetical protein